MNSKTKMKRPRWLLEQPQIRSRGQACDSAILLDGKRDKFPRPAFAFINRKDQLHVMAKSLEHRLLKIADSQEPDPASGFDGFGL